MTVDIPPWLLPVVVTVAIWVWALTRPNSKPISDYDIAPMFRDFAILVWSSIGTLTIWLLFLGYRVWVLSGPT